MAKTKKKKKGRGTDARANGDEAATTYVDLLATLQPVARGLVKELTVRQERRSQHLFSLLTQFPELLEGLSQLQEALRWLAGQSGVNVEVAHLLREAETRVVSGTEFLLSQADPRVLDEARYLMEVEFLLLDFARDPDRLDVWTRTPQLERSRQFDFDVLCRRQQEAAGAPAGRVLFDQEEYRMHGSTTHPRPIDPDPPLSAPDAATGLFFDAADLIHHAMRVWTAGLAAAGATGAVAAVSLEARRPALAAVDAALQLIDNTHRSIGLLELTGAHRDRSQL